MPAAVLDHHRGRRALDQGHIRQHLVVADAFGLGKAEDLILERMVELVREQELEQRRGRRRRASATT